MLAAGKEPAVYEPGVAGNHQGIAVDRFFHFGGFVSGHHARTHEAAIMGKRDELRGLKENVMVTFDSCRYWSGLTTQLAVVRRQERIWARHT